MGRIQSVPERGQVANALEGKWRAADALEVTWAEGNAGFVARYIVVAVRVQPC